MEAWEQFAAALAASPAVEELVVSPRALCGDDEAQWDDPWMAVRGKGFAATCVLRATGVSCRALGPVDGGMDCDEGWNGGKPIPPPRPARALVAGWPGFPDVSVSPVAEDPSKLPPMLYVHGAGDRLAMRAGERWRVTTGIPGADPELPQRAPRVDLTHSFDASALAGRGAWGIVTSWYGGCGQGGTTHWNLTVLRSEGDRLVTLAERSLGSVSWYHRELSGVRLIPSLGTPGVVLLDVAPGTLETDRTGDAIRADVGAWQIRDGQFVRLAEP